MADEIVEAAQVLQDQADAKTEAAEAATEIALEQAQERVEIAEKTSQQIMDAAMQTAIGQRIDGLEKDLNECRTTIQAHELTMAEMRDQISSLKTPVQSSSIPAASVEIPAQPEAEQVTTATLETAAVPLPARESGVDPEDRDGKPTINRPRRRIL